MKKSELRKMIREELLKEDYYGSPEEVGRAMVHWVDELHWATKVAVNPEDWATKYWRSGKSVIEMIKKLIPILEKMK